jgi:broad specificity phosphatase PhoE
LAAAAATATSSRLIACEPPRAIFSSPMLRARQTARIIAGQFPQLKIHISRGLNEVYSPYEGGPVALVERSHWNVYEGIPANFEQPEDVLARALKFIAAVCQKFPGDCVLAVSHGDLIYFLTLWATGQPLFGQKEQTFYPTQASISSFIFEGDGSGKPEYHYYKPEIN